MYNADVTTTNFVFKARDNKVINTERHLLFSHTQVGVRAFLLAKKQTNEMRVSSPRM